jgi:hypothetical protein
MLNPVSTGAASLGMVEPDPVCFEGILDRGGDSNTPAQRHTLVYR